MAGTELFSAAAVERLRCRFPDFDVERRLRGYETTWPRNKPLPVLRRIMENTLAKRWRELLGRFPQPDPRDLDPATPTLSDESIDALVEDFGHNVKNIPGRIAHALATWCSPEMYPSRSARHGIILSHIINLSQAASWKDSETLPSQTQR